MSAIRLMAGGGYTATARPTLGWHARLGYNARHPGDPLAFELLQPPVPLPPVVDALWVARARAVPEAFHVLPDGCEDLIVTLTGPPGAGSVARSVTTSGVTAAPRPVLLGPGTMLVGVRFRPGGARQVLGPDVPAAADRLCRHLPRAMPTPADAARWLAGVVADAASRRRDPTRQATVDAAVGQLGRGASVAQAAREVGLGERSLLRLFHEQVGVSPKRLARILRFRAALAAVADGCDLATAAARCGYVDQPHLTREFVALGGASPRALLRRRCV